YGHSRITFKRRVISSAGTSSPWPEPGETGQGCRPSSGGSTLVSPNGQGRDWGGGGGGKGAAAGRAVEEGVAVGLFGGGQPAAALFGVECAHHLDVFIEERGDGGQVLVVDPDEAGLAGAAVAALRAGEPQPVAIPGFAHGRPPDGTPAAPARPGRRGLLD